MSAEAPAYVLFAGRAGTLTPGARGVVKALRLASARGAGAACPYLPVPRTAPCRQHHPPVRLPMAWRRLNCLCVTTVHRLLGWGRELQEAEARTGQRLEQ